MWKCQYCTQSLHINALQGRAHKMCILQLSVFYCVENETEFLHVICMYEGRRILDNWNRPKHTRSARVCSHYNSSLSVAATREKRFIVMVFYAQAAMVGQPTRPSSEASSHCEFPCHTWVKHVLIFNFPKQKQNYNNNHK